MRCLRLDSASSLNVTIISTLPLQVAMSKASTLASTGLNSTSISVELRLSSLSRFRTTKMPILLGNGTQRSEMSILPQALMLMQTKPVEVLSAATFACA